MSEMAIEKQFASGKLIKKHVANNLIRCMHFGEQQ